MNSLSSKFIIGIIVLTLSFPISPQTRSYVPEHADVNVRQPASMTDSLEQVSPEETLEGSLIRIWDAVEDTGEEAAYYLNTQEAGQVRLEIQPEILQAFKSFVVDQPYLAVTGVWQADHSAFQVQRFEAGHPSAEEDRSSSDRTEPGWTVDGSKITGNTPWVTVLCKFPDIEETPYDMNYYLYMYGSDYPELNDYWKEASNNAINLDGSAVAGWYTLPYASTSLEYTTGATIGLVREHCLAAADDDVDFSQFYGVNLMFNHNIWSSFAWGGCGTYQLEGEARHAGITTTFPGNGGGLANLVHEMGHGYCLPHSFINEGDQPYANAWDVMSSSYSGSDPYWGSLPQHTIALNKYNLGWIDESKVLTVQMPFDQTFTLARTAQPLTDDYRMAKIILDENTIYTLETRQTTIPYDSQLPATAVIIHKYNAVTDKISLITKGGSIGAWFPTAYWTVGETYVDVDYGLTFTVTGSTETGFIIDLSLDELTPFAGCSTQSSIPIPECEALVSLYNELEGPNWIGPRGWLTHPDPCMWTGVTCLAGTVIELQLITENLTGVLPPSIGALINLKALTIWGNLTGALPPELENLSQLKELDLRANQLTGRIPPELGSLSNLTSLDLYGNRLTGSIPTELTYLTLLTWLRLSNNLLTGTLPDGIGNMTSLVSLQLDDNQLYGPIPLSITLLTDMHSFSFRNTYLCEPSASETAYWEWVAMTPVENYWNDGVVCYTEPPFSGCVTQSSIPDAECDALVSLYNALDGPDWDINPIWLFDSNPCTWGGVTCTGGVVTSVDLTAGLVGTIPASVGDLANLTQLRLESEGLTGVIPASVGEMSQLQSLILKGNLTQTIPAELGSLSNLQTLNLQENQLTGVIPPELGNISNLQTLNLQGNQLTGSIPPELGQINYFYELNLSDNQLEGSIPSIFNSISIEHLVLSNNNLSGPLPPDLTLTGRYRTLDLHGNLLTGPLPSYLGNFMDVVDLSDNLFEGSIPPLWGWGVLRTLNLSNNNLSGTLPEMYNVNIESVNLDHNPLFGPLPETMTDLTNLRTFSFRYTNLCEPSDPEFQTWKEQTIEYWYDEGAVCETGLQFYLPLIVD